MTGRESASIFECRGGGMADAEDSKSSVGNHVRVQVPPSAPSAEKGAVKKRAITIAIVVAAATIGTSASAPQGTYYVVKIAPIEQDLGTNFRSSDIVKIAMEGVVPTNA